MNKGRENKLYPNIWEYDDLLEDVKEEIDDYFYMLKDFYSNALKKNKDVLVTIF